MSPTNFNKNHSVTSWAPLIGLLIFTVYLLINTGLATDDYVHLWDGLTNDWTIDPTPSGYISIPILHFTHAALYHLIGYDYPVAYDIVKFFYVFLSILAIKKFLSIYYCNNTALILAFIFVFYPLHDGVTFWLTGLYLLISMAFYLFAAYLAHHSRTILATLFSFLGSFSSYGSPPIAAGLTVLFAMQRRWKACLIMLLPNLIYIFYYLFLLKYIGKGTERLTSDASVLAIIKQFIVQIASFADAAFGPSFLIKVYAAIASLSLVSIVIGTLVTMMFYRFYSARKVPVDRHLVVSMAIIVLLAFMTFSLTGLYPQMAFSLGNRVTIYGSLFIVVLLSSIRLSRPMMTILFAIFVFTVLGISDHWKAWNIHTQEIAENIRTNRTLAELPADTIVFVSGNQYSQLGPFRHIDFFTASHAVETFTLVALKHPRQYKVYPFSRRMSYQNNTITDNKYNISFPVDKTIWVYDSINNQLTKVAEADIAQTLSTLPLEIRHWTQLLGDGLIKDAILFFMPRLKHAY